MSDAYFQRTHSVEVERSSASPRPLPIGYGLLIGAVASLALWAGLFWLALKLLG